MSSLGSSGSAGRRLAGERGREVDRAEAGGLLVARRVDVARGKAHDLRGLGGREVGPRGAEPGDGGRRQRGGERGPVEVRVAGR